MNYMIINCLIVGDILPELLKSILKEANPL
jgi:hypothetical protein